MIRGNHDKAACGLDDGSQFNQVARLAAAWTGQFLTPEQPHYLRELPMGPVQIDDLVEICHGTPFDEDYYIFDGNDARDGMRSARRGRSASSATRTCRRSSGSRTNRSREPRRPDPETILALAAGAQYLVNAGLGRPAA